VEPDPLVQGKEADRIKEAKTIRRIFALKKEEIQQQGVDVISV
jgi:hypothetical protein